MQPLKALGDVLSEQANDQLDNLKAIKGEGFATLVAELLNMRSVGSIITQAMDVESPVSQLAVIVLSQFQSRHMQLLREKVGVPTEQIDEVVEWAERIFDSTQRTISTALETGGSDSLH
jgi:hypothetical protein